MKETGTQTPPINEPVSTFRTVREMIEVLGIALVLAFLFKAYVIELFCIPTGSMASTLMGRHKDVNCEICGFPFQLGASRESNEGSERPLAKNQLPSIIGGTCPQCQYTMYVGSDNLAGQTYMSFSGDRIFANKSLFSYREPRRWHVTIFRYPAKPQTNYIKRLVGLENETVMLRNGQVFVQKEGTDHFEIQRKPLRSLLSMLRPVDDNDYVIPAIHELGWKTRWYGDDEHWQRSADYKSFAGSANGSETSWLKFRYITATTRDWYYLIQGQLPEHNPTGTPQLITDSLAYNTNIVQSPSGPRRDVYNVETPQHGEIQLCRRNSDGLGLNWVGDLAVQCTLNVEKPEGTVSFRLIKGGTSFQCDLDFTIGNAVFSIPGVPEFEPFSVVVPLRAAGHYDVMFCNVDEEMRLIIDGKEIDTQGRGRYDALCSDDLDNPLSRDRSPTVLDLEPAAIGVREASVRVENLKIKRNLYYISCNETTRDNNNCDLIFSPFQYGFSFDEESVKRILSSPGLWKDFGKTRQTVFRLGKDQFLMCGDNSAQSKDSRLWTEDKIPHYVERKYLVGEAIYVFWPHGFRIPGTRLALIPNFPKMRWID